MKPQAKPHRTPGQECDAITEAIDAVLAQPVVTPSELLRLDRVHTMEYQLFQNVLQGTLSYEESEIALAMYINWIDGGETDAPTQQYLGQLSLIEAPVVEVISPLL